jgi:hypothetical protein
LSYNKPFREKHTSCITPVSVVPDEDLLNKKNIKVKNADFLRKEQEITLKIEK